MAVVGVKGGTGEILDLRADNEQRENNDTHLQTHKAKVWVQGR